jgi:hypothetical protein
MKKEFVPYTESLALKELGFESSYPIGEYQGGKVFYYENGELHYDGRPMYSSDSHSGQLLAPLYQQAFRWFREKYGLYYLIKVFKDDDGELIFDYVILEDSSDTESYDDEPYTTYEEAENACLIKLIEIVKTK